MKYPALKIDLNKLRHNAEVVVGILRPYGIRVMGVSKALLSHADVAKTMLEGGVEAIGDSRIKNLRSLGNSGCNVEKVLLRAPSPSQCYDAVSVADTSLNSHVPTVEMLGEAAIKQGKVHNVVLMVDLGDLREGVLVSDAVEVARQMAKVKGVRLIGIGTNMACYGGVIPTEEKMEELVELRNEIQSVLGISIPRISGGNSANMPIAIKGEIPPGITELRIGESILLGTEAVRRTQVPGCHLDVFTLEAEIIEVLTKPSLPFGDIGQDAFGIVRVFEDLGVRRRAIVSVGRQDVEPDGLTPLDMGVKIIGASSDHLICDVGDAGSRVEVGDILKFGVDYGALLKASTSPYVEKVVF